MFQFKHNTYLVGRVKKVTSEFSTIFNHSSPFLIKLSHHAKCYRAKSKLALTLKYSQTKKLTIELDYTKQLSLL